MLQEKIDKTRSLLSNALEAGDLKQVSLALRPHSSQLAGWAEAFWKTRQFPPHAADRLVKLNSAFAAPFVPYRFLLITNSLQSLDRLAGLPLADEVKLLMCDEFCAFLNPDPDWAHFYDPAEYSYRALTGISLCKRFRAGLLDWEEAGFPRSWLLKVPRHQLLSVLRYLAFRMGGFKPFWFPHNAFLRGKIQFMREREWEASLVLMAKSMVLQPQIKGVLTGSWFYCPDTHRVTPHLAWTTRIFVENGAFVTNIGPADPGAGFQQGSPERQALYASGQYKPTETILLWPRRNLLDWLQNRPAKPRKG